MRYLLKGLLFTLALPTAAMADVCSGGCSVSVDQIPPATTATVVQNGSNNYARVLQKGSSSDAATIVQGPARGGDASSAQASDNRAEIAQFGAGANLLSAAQSGSNNVISSRQVAFFGENSSTIRQSGSGNTASLVQVGANNTAVQTQSGMNDQEGVVQYGNNNSAVYSQVGNGLQNVGLTEVGNNETITIAQQSGAPTVITVSHK